MEVQIKRTPPGKPESPYGIEPPSHEPRIRRWINTTTIFGEKGPFGNHIESGKQRQPFVHHITHDMAVPGASKQFEPQKGAHRLPGGNHLRPRESRFFQQPLQRDLGQIRDEQIDPSELSSKSPGGEIQLVHIGDLGYLRPGSGKAFLVSSSGQSGKPFFLENQRDGNGAHPLSGLFQYPADIIDGEIPFSQCDDLVPNTVGLRRNLRPLLRGKKERPIRILTELMGEDAEASRGIPEAMGHFGRGEMVHEIGPKGFVLTMSGIGRL
jgi:hypothetical protein